MAAFNGMITQQSIPELGEIVTVRQRRYLVEGIVAPPSASDSTLVRLSCVDDDAQGQPMDVLWELELDAEVLTADAWDGIAQKGFDPPDRFGAYLNTKNCWPQALRAWTNITRSNGTRQSTGEDKARNAKN